MSRSRGRPRYADVLTPAEWRVVDAVRHGMTNRQIADRRGTSVEAVKYHVSNALAKLGLPDRRALRHWDGVPAGSALAVTNEGEDTMTTTDLRLGPIGQIARPTKDIERAVAWYRDVLGLPHLYTFGDLAFFDCGGTRLFLSAGDEGAGAEPSLLYFRVGDIQAAHRELTARGVVFTSAPHLIHRHDSGMEEWMALFTDVDDQLLALMAQVTP
ncbi:VOC family protein [Jiangella alkaliphila]|uniref:VOC family protein n=1 Tax=Jiangella alkaliphila TaxID=419479 RepID=UPI0009E37897|nr:VOC family protein [Jiangella alkaliphila]